jgi:DNA invertase Pin-like site-specific DNA recombinase
MVVRMLGVVAEWERETVSERTSAALKAKADRGEYTGGKGPFGKQLSEDGKHLEDNPEEQAILNDIRQLRERGHTFGEVAEKLNESGARRRNGNKWHRKAVSRTLKQGAYE